MTKRTTHHTDGLMEWSRVYVDNENPRELFDQIKSAGTNVPGPLDALAEWDRAAKAMLADRGEPADDYHYLRHHPDGVVQVLGELLSSCRMTRKQIERNDAMATALFMAQASSLATRLELQPLVPLVNAAKGTRQGQAKARENRRIKVTPERMRATLDRLSQQHPQHNITWLRRKATDELGISMKWLLKQTTNYNPKKN